MHVTLFELHADDVQFGPKHIGRVGGEEGVDIEVEEAEAEERTVSGPPRGLFVLLALVAVAVMLRRRRAKGSDEDGAEVEIVA